jgi:hypothetical protein
MIQKYYIDATEIWEQTYAIYAENSDEAKTKIEEGHGEPIGDMTFHCAYQPEEWVVAQRDD